MIYKVYKERSLVLRWWEHGTQACIVKNLIPAHHRTMTPGHKPTSSSFFKILADLEAY